jgi:hypothetical protein
MPEAKLIKTPFDAAIAELEAQIAERNSALQVLKRLRDSAGGSNGTSSVKASSLRGAVIAVGTPPWDDSEIRSDAFFKMTIADAAIKFLRKWAGHTPQSTKAIIAALDRGGIKGKGYQTVYKILTRRAKEKKDVVNVHGDWGLPEWYFVDDPSQQQAPPAFSGAALRDQQG